MQHSKYQLAIFDAVKNTNKNICVEATAGCLGFNTPILMYSGTIKMVQDIEIGDLVMGPDSTPRKVLKINSGNSQLYKINPVKGESWVCNDEHILTVHNESIARNIKQYKNTHHTSPLIDIEIRNLLNKNKITTSKGVKSLNLATYRLQRVKVDFNRAHTLIEPYIIGLWLGDGQTAGTTIYTIDEPIVSFLKNRYPQSTIRKDKTCTSVYLHESSTSQKNIFRQIFKECVKDNEKYIPNKYLINDTENRLQLLAGLVDSDGYIGRGYLEFTFKSKTLANDITFLCRSLGFAAYQTQVKRKCQNGSEGLYHHISISGSLEIIPTLLDRKRAKKRIKSKDVLRTGFSIENISIGRWYGFTVDKDHRFLLGDFTITHNSGKTTTLLEILKLLPRTKRSVFLSFSNTIVNELKNRVPMHVKASTLHSLGCRMIMKYYKRCQIDENKFFKKLVGELTTEERTKEGYRFCGQVSDIINYARMTLTAASEQRLTEMCNHYSLDYESRHIAKAIEILNEPVKWISKIDFTDMIYLPALDIRLIDEQYDYVLLDEAQDLNNAQRLFLEKIIKPGGRLIAVGDSQQCQPTGTKILMWNGEEKNIEDIKIGDAVVSYERKSQASFVGYSKSGRKVKSQQVLIENVASRPYNGDLIQITTANNVSRYTPEHRCIIRFRADKTDGHILYLMEKNGMFRIGITPLWSKNQHSCGYFRGVQEGADKMWFLDILDKKNAYLKEQYYSCKYGIPQMIWNIAYQKRLLNQEDIDNFYSQFDSEQQLNQAKQLLQEFNRDIKFPIWNRLEKTHMSKTHMCEIKAINIIPAFMQMVEFDNTNVKLITYRSTSPYERVKAKYVDIESKTIIKYEGLVYSLQVAKHQVYVADRILTHNCIYSFSGSSIDSFEKLKQRPNTITLPLSISYRCAQRIVQEARKVYDTIEAYEGNIQGVVRVGDIEEVEEGDMVVCRKTAPLITAFFDLLDNDIKATIIGKDIESGLLRLAEKVQGGSEEMVTTRIDQELIRTREELENLGFKNIKTHPKYVSLVDKCEVIEALMKRSDPNNLVNTIKELFREDRKAVRLMTIHRSKGLECDRVFLIEKHNNAKLIPSPYATQSWELTQESNLLFVAVTRAKKELVYVYLNDN